MNKKPIILVVAAACVVAVSWYSLIVVPSVRQPATGAGGVTAAAPPHPSGSVRTARSDQTAQAGGAALDPAQSPSDQPSLDPEQLAIANARKPIEEQAPEVQQRYYEGMLMGLRRAQDLQRGSLARLEQQLQTTRDPTARARLDQQIEERRKWLTERDQRIAEYESRKPPSLP